MYPLARNPTLVADDTARHASLAAGLTLGVVAGSAAWIGLRKRVGGWGILFPVIGAFSAWSTWSMMHAFAPEHAEQYFPT